MAVSLRPILIIMLIIIIIVIIMIATAFFVVIIGSVITIIVILSMIMIVITIIIPEARQPLQSSEALRDALRQIPFSRPQLRDEGAQEDANRAKNKRKCPAVM